MKHRILGRTNLSVSEIGFGSAPMGYLQTPARDAERLLNDVLDLGVNLVDTAASYPGAEETIGRAIGLRRDECVLVTKCGSPGAPPDDPSWSPDELARSVDRSLERLRTDRLDVVLLHSCQLPTLQRGAALDRLAELRDAGKIRFVGYSGDNEVAEYAMSLADVTVVEVSINICDQANIDRVLPGARRRRLGVIAKRPMANAAWKGLGRQPGIYADYARTYVDRLTRMQISLADMGLVGPPNELWPEVALRFTLSQPGVHCAIIGTTQPAHLRSNIAAAQRGPLPENVVERIRTAFRLAEANALQTWPGEM